MEIKELDICRGHVQKKDGEGKVGRTYVVVEDFFDAKVTIHNHNE